MPIRRCLAEIRKLDRFVALSMDGLRAGAHATEHLALHRKAALVLRDPDPFPSEEAYQEALRKAEELEAFGKEQANCKYSYLFGLATIKLWSLLESAVDDLVADALRTPQACRDQEMINSLKGPLVEYAAADSEERGDLLLSELKLTLRARLRPGVGRLEVILDPVGLGGSVDGAVRRALLELSSTRHVLIHRAGVADQRFVEACPWLDVSVGLELPVGGHQFHRYVAASHWYLLALDNRLRRKRDGSRSPTVEDLQETLARAVRESYEGGGSISDSS